MREKNVELAQKNWKWESWELFPKVPFVFYNCSSHCICTCVCMCVHDSVFGLGCSLFFFFPKAILMPDTLVSGKAHTCPSPLSSDKCSYSWYLQILQWPWNQINLGWIKSFIFLHHTLKCLKKISNCFLFCCLFVCFPIAAPLEFLYTMVMSRKVLTSRFFVCSIFHIFIVAYEKLPFIF